MGSIEAAIPYPTPPLTGESFVLRPFREDDFDAAARLERDEAAARWVPPLPAVDGAGAVEFYEACRTEGSLLHLVIADRTDDAYLGETMLAFDEHRVAETGCVIVPEARGQGIATETLRLVTSWGFTSLGLCRVQVLVAPENAPALRLALAAGFQREGVLRSYSEVDGERHDAVVLSRLPGDAS